MYEALGFPDSAERAAREHDRLLSNPWAVPLLPRVLQRQGRGEEAVTIARRWAVQRQTQHNVQGAALARLEVADLLLEQGRAEEARLEAGRAERWATELNLMDELIHARRLAGEASVRLGHADGLAALREAATLARAHPTTDALRETHRALGDALADGGSVAEALRAYDRAARAVERVVGHLAEDLDRARYRARQLAPFDGALRLLLRQPDSEERSNALLHWSQRRKAAALSIAALSSAGPGFAVRAPLPLEQLRRRLDADEALVDYVLVDGRAAAIAVTRRRATARNLDVSVDSLRSWIDRLTSPFMARAGGRVDVARVNFDSGTARKLYVALINPVEDLISGHARLTIVPDGVLHFLPFEAMYLVDRFEITHVPSAQFLAGRSRGGTDASAGRLLVLAHQAPGGESEVAAIREAWGADRVSVVLGDAATETAVHDRGGVHAIVHFAAHAAVDAEDPLRSHLRLAADTANDGYLHLNEIATSRLAARLVVLSACETALGRLYEGEGPMGLARAFLASGARNVVATRWPVGAPAADLMAVFYRRLAAGASPASALREAMLALRRNPATANPFFWAGFLLIEGG